MNVREQDLNAHLTKQKHVNYKEWPLGPDAGAPPAAWGDPRLFKYAPEHMKWKCLLCKKFADDKHVRSDWHRKWVPYAADFIPELQDTAPYAVDFIQELQAQCPPQPAPWEPPPIPSNTKASWVATCRILGRQPPPPPHAGSDAFWV